MRVDMKGAIEHTGLTDYTIRKAIREKKLPFLRLGGGKYIFETELLDKAIEKMMLESTNVEL